MSLLDYSKEELVHALLRIKDKYPATFLHFIWSEINPEAYETFLYNLGRDNDSRKSYPRLGKKQEANSGSSQSNQEALEEVPEARKTL